MAPRRETPAGSLIQVGTIVPGGLPLVVSEEEQNILFFRQQKRQGCSSIRTSDLDFHEDSPPHCSRIRQLREDRSPRRIIIPKPPSWAYLIQREIAPPFDQDTTIACLSRPTYLSIPGSLLPIVVGSGSGLCSSPGALPRLTPVVFHPVL